MILVHFGPYWSKPVQTSQYWSTGMFWYIRSMLEKKWSILAHVGPYLSILVNIGTYWSILFDVDPLDSVPVHLGPSWSILIHTGPLLVHTGSYWFILVLTDHLGPSETLLVSCLLSSNFIRELVTASRKFPLKVDRALLNSFSAIIATTKSVNFRI